MITEKTINHIIGQFAADEVDYEKTVREFAGRQPAVLSFLMSDLEGVLTNDEQDYLLYLAVIIWRSAEYVGSGLISVEPEKIAAMEEANWVLLEGSKNRSFRERLDVFFANTTEEDLLAFIEDSLTETDDEEEVNVTPEGREAIFVALKTVVDLLTDEASR